MNRQGFTLVEMMVAIFMVAVAVLMFSYFMNPLRLSRDSQIETQALATARTYLDNLRASWQNDCNYVAATLPPTPTNVSNLRLSVQDARTNAQLFTFDSANASPSVTNTGYLRNVTLSVTASNGKVIELSTQVARPSATVAPTGCS
jgi:prepilin-type N-terminal cleavage/methylation domain-containing protein